MPMLSDKDRQFLENYLKEHLIDAVTIKFFTQAISCQFCKETEQLLNEVAALSDKIHLETYNFVLDKEAAQELGIQRIPAIAILGEKDYGIRFYGIPSGYEFNTLIEDIVAVSTKRHGLSEETVQKLGQIQEPVHIQVFVTPTCPYCPTAVRMAHALAMANDHISADMIESVEFPHLANRYQVYSVPKTIINERVELEGAVPEPLFVAKVLQAVGLVTEEEVERLFQSFEGQIESS